MRLPLISRSRAEPACALDQDEALIRAMIDGALPYDGHAARRVALRLTAGIVDKARAADLHDDLLFEIDVVQMQLTLDEHPPFVERFRHDAHRRWRGLWPRRSHKLTMSGRACDAQSHGRTHLRC